MTTPRTTRLLAAVLGAVVLAGCGSTPAAPAPAPPVAAASTPAAAPVTRTPTAPRPATRPAATTAPVLRADGTRPANGAVLVSRGARGAGELTVVNGTGQDALVTLARGGRAVRAVHVRAGATARLGRVADGRYDVHVMRGSGWNAAAGRFATGLRTDRFDRPASFTTERVRRGTRYTKVSLTLHPVPDGNARTVPVDPSRYPR